MGRKKIPGARGSQCHFKGLAGLFHEVAGAFEYGKCRVTFIQMTHFRFDPESTKQTPSAYPKQDFLLETQFGPTAVELACDSPVNGEIRGVVTVQEVKLQPAKLNIQAARFPDAAIPRLDVAMV